MRCGWLVKGACFVFLAAGPLLVAIPSWGDDAPRVDDSSARAPRYVATILERKDGSVTLQKEDGEVVILSLDDSGLTLRIDRDVVKGSRVTVAEERVTATSRTVTVKRAPAS